MKKKLLLTSILTIVMCLSLTVGATFALFTSDSTVNLSVSSGTVKVTSNFVEDSVATKQLYEDEYTAGADHMYEGVVTFAENYSKLSLTNLVPGDAIKFQLKVVNESTVTVKYRTVVSCANNGGLFDALEVSIAGISTAYDGDTFTTKWAQMPAGEQFIDIEIEFPENESNNLYQDKSCSITYFIEAVQGNAKTFDPVYKKQQISVDESTNTTTEEVVIGSGSSATIPENTKLNPGVKELKFIVTEADNSETGSFTFDKGEEILPLDITVLGVAEDNDKVITITLEGVLESGLDNVILFHKGIQMTSVRFAKSEYAADEFFYDKATGNVTIATTHFSNFTVVIGGEGNGFPVADIEVLDESLFPTEDYILNLEGMMSFPDIREDIALEKAFTFIATQTAEEVELSPYKNWLCDFVISCDQDVAIGELGLSGQYGFADLAKQTTWYTFGNPIELTAGAKLPMLTSFGLPQTYEMICRDVQSFSCGIFRGQNNKSMAGKTITVSLCIADIETVSSKLDREPTMEDFSEADGTLITIASIDYTFEVIPEGIVNSAFTSETGFWGDWGGNASESFEIKIYSNDTYLGSSSLNNVGGIIDGDVYVTWSLYLDVDAHQDEYWTQTWVQRPTKDLLPTKAVLYVDGVNVGESAIQLNGPDGINKIVACVVNENNEIVKFLTELSFEDLVNPYIVLLSDVELNGPVVIG